ncbi:MAG: colanic acid biosynthesis glycosyltransferase WcaL, partial [Leptolyngbya sp. SIO4C1]|nr:colanic acid biosynthesis glycosyltransferase WcaL [Leptolyngbya sp. SIO4C1]
INIGTVFVFYENCLLVNEFPSLSETFILNQITGLVQAGHSVDIYARNAQKASKIHPLVEEYQLVNNTYYYPYLPANYFLRALKALWLIIAYFWKAPKAILKALNFKKYGRHASSFRLLYCSIAFIQQGCPTYDIIMCHFGPTGLVALDFRDINVLSGKICVTFHGLDLSAYLIEAGEDIYAPLFEKADLLLPISDFWKQRLIELGCNPNKIQIHRMGIDLEHFAFKPRKTEEEQKVRLVSVARLVEKKGIEYSIRALQKVAQQYPAVEYIVIGDGPLMHELSQLVQTLELQNVVQLLGWQQQDEVAKILSTAHILLAPSVTSSNGDMEGIPVALMEAMATGIPVISTWHSGIPELIHHEKSGILVPERNSSELALQILNLIQDPESWSRLGQ